MLTSSFDIIGEKKKQDYLVFQKTKPQNYQIVKDMILDFDLKNSLIKILKENISNSEKIKLGFKKYLLERQAYLNEMISNL
jgi:hypothetical protein